MDYHYFHDDWFNDILDEAEKKIEIKAIVPR